MVEDKLIIASVLKLTRDKVGILALNTKVARVDKAITSTFKLTKLEDTVLALNSFKTILQHVARENVGDLKGFLLADCTPQKSEFKERLFF